MFNCKLPGKMCRARHWNFEIYVSPEFLVWLDIAATLQSCRHSCFSRAVEIVFLHLFEMRMKITDDYKAKYRLWAANPTVVPAPPAIRLPDFKSRRFSSHAELNAWKLSMLRQLAQLTPAR